MVHSTILYKIVQKKKRIILSMIMLEKAKHAASIHKTICLTTVLLDDDDKGIHCLKDACS